MIVKLGKKKIAYVGHEFIEQWPKNNQVLTIFLLQGFLV